MIEGDRGDIWIFGRTVRGLLGSDLWCWVLLDYGTIF